MSALLLDAGALVAIDKGDPRIAVILRVAQRERLPLRTSAAVVAQVWRDGAKQVNLGRALRGVSVRPLDSESARRAGELLGASGTSDVVDAHFALSVDSDDRVLTSDTEDVRRLLHTRGVEARIVEV